MGKLATTKMSSRGQVVIPESVRNELKLSAGTQFAVLGKGDVVVLKHIKPPRLEEFAKIRAEVRKQARKAGMTKSAVSAAVRKVRKRK